MAATTLNTQVFNSEANTLEYFVNQALLEINTILPCEIIEVNADGTYDVQPLINYLSATALSNNTSSAPPAVQSPVSQATPYAAPEIYNVPAAVIQGGNAGIILPYKVGDKVIVGFVQRDMSIVKKTWTTNNPGSFRKFSLSDGVILGALSHTPPTVYIKFNNAGGIEITAPSAPISVHATEVDINAGVVKLGTGASLGVLLENHPLTVTLAGVQPGSGVTGVAMTVTAGGSTHVKGII